MVRRGKDGKADSLNILSQVLKVGNKIFERLLNQRKFSDNLVLIAFLPPPKITNLNTRRKVK